MPLHKDWDTIPISGQSVRLKMSHSVIIRFCEYLNTKPFVFFVSCVFMD